MFDFVFEVEDQRDWRRCGKNPFSCFFCHLLNVLGVRALLDLTYGVGSFYEHCSSLYIIAVDVAKHDWVVKPAEFHQQDALEFLRRFHGRVDAVVLDPPFSTNKTPRRHVEQYDVLHNGRFPFSKVVQAVKLGRTKAKHVILKYMPTLEEEIELLRLSPRHVITWRFFMRNVLANGNVVVRNASKIYIY
ncbi:MAG: hypothetical protein QXI07_08990 [Pyrobaculum sp.]